MNQTLRSFQNEKIIPLGKESQPAKKLGDCKGNIGLSSHRKVLTTALYLHANVTALIAV